MEPQCCERKTKSSLENLSFVDAQAHEIHVSVLLVARLPPEQDPAVELGRVPGPIEVGEEVLARWSDEGWYYRGNQYFFRFCIK